MQYAKIAKFSLQVLAAAVYLSLAALPALAQAPAAPGEIPLSVRILQMMPLFMILLLVFYLMVIKPQNEQDRRYKALMEGLKEGQMVVTSGGLIGKVAGIKQDHILLELANNVRVKVEKAHIKKRRDADGPAKADSPSGMAARRD